MNWNFGNIDFSTYPAYEGDDLGVALVENRFQFVLWSPVASQVEVSIYREGDGGEPVCQKELVHEKSGIWKGHVGIEYKNHFYTLRFKVNGEWLNEIPDIYAKAVGINGKRGMLCNFAETNPAGWENDKRCLPEYPTDAILYELHVRDFSIDPYSGMKNKGKYLAFTEEDTYSPEGMKTGLNHLKELGITHVHLLPVYDFFTVDEAHPEKNEYNWGYDPLNYNAPEGSYASDAHDGKVRIKEFKQLVKALHDNGIGVVMDVVYNHTGLIETSYFNQSVPGYFYRQRPNGKFSDASGCGTEIASERYMVRKYIVESILHWATEYHIDGFRFDLMGVLDIDTMNLIREKLDSIDPKILMYGEGWTAAESPLMEKFRAVKSRTRKLNGIASFNDDFRDAVKGGWGHGHSIGYASGQTLEEEPLKSGIVASTYNPQLNYNYIPGYENAWAPEPTQCVNYVSCHDNHTLYDKFKLSRQDATRQELARMVCLSAALLFTSQGIAFMHAGMEKLRTKKGHGNSYKSPDSINMIDWSRKLIYHYVFSYFKKLIEIRKKHPAFRMPTTLMIEHHLKFSEHYIPGVIAYELGPNANNDSWKWIQVVFNNNPHPIVFSVARRNWTEIVREMAIDEEGLSTHLSDTIFVPKTSMMMLISND